MKIIQPSVEILTPIDGAEILSFIETCGRTCYKSEAKITPDSAEAFVRRIIKSGHESVLEHRSITVRFICDRGVSHELVRHRLASFSQESTRYCDYSRERFGENITVIKPCFFDEDTPQYSAWYSACLVAERQYFELRWRGASPQEARTVLPNSLKTEVVMTANLREWRHFLQLRTGVAAHPQMREIATMLLARLRTEIPVVFDDIPLSDSSLPNAKKVGKHCTFCKTVAPDCLCLRCAKDNYALGDDLKVDCCNSHDFAGFTCNIGVISCPDFVPEG